MEITKRKDLRAEKLKQLRQRAALHVLHAAFGAWSQRISPADQVEHFGYMTSLCCLKLRYHVLHHCLARAIKKELQQAQLARLNLHAAWSRKNN